MLLWLNWRKYLQPGSKIMWKASPEEWMLKLRGFGTRCSTIRRQLGVMFWCPHTFGRQQQTRTAFGSATLQLYSCLSALYDNRPDYHYQCHLFLSPSVSFCLCFALFASGPFQSGEAAANCLTPDLADNTTTETDDSHEL